MTSHTARHFLAATLAAFAFGATGCSLIVDFNECSTDADCASGTCADGICAGPAACATRSDCAEGFYCLSGTCGQLEPTDAQCKGMQLGRAFEEDTLIVPIGGLMPLTGINGPRGIATIDGAELAIRQINQARGLQEGRFGIITCDTEYVAARAVSAADWLTNEVGVQAFIGAISSSETLDVAAEVCIEEEAVLISPASTSPAISGLNDSDLIWRTIPSDALQAPAMVTLARALEPAPTKVAVVVVNSAYGTGFLQEINNAWIELDSALVSSDDYRTLRYAPPVDGEVAAADLATIGESLFSGASALSPDVVLLIGAGEGLDLIFDLEENHVVAGSEPQWILSEALQDNALLDSKFQPYWPRIQGTTPQRVETATYQTFRQNYSAEFSARDARDFPFSDKAFDAAYVLALAIASLESPLEATGADIAGQIRKMTGGSTSFTLNTSEFNAAATALNQGQIIDVEGASGDLDFDTRGDVSSPMARWSVTGGSFNAVEPITVETAE
jgi:branched-chain amino acid transport system substrate-binding protein